MGQHKRIRHLRIAEPVGGFHVCQLGGYGGVYQQQHRDQGGTLQKVLLRERLPLHASALAAPRVAAGAQDLTCPRMTQLRHVCHKVIISGRRLPSLPRLYIQP